MGQVFSAATFTAMFIALLVTLYWVAMEMFTAAQVWFEYTTLTPLV
jgi:hypothetical protein